MIGEAAAVAVESTVASALAGSEAAAPVGWIVGCPVGAAAAQPAIAMTTAAMPMRSAGFQLGLDGEPTEVGERRSVMVAPWAPMFPRRHREAWSSRQW